MPSRPLSPAEEGIAAFELATGQDACERLLSIDGLPDEVDTQTRRKMVDLAPPLATIAPSARSWPLHLPVPGGWTTHGASIAWAPGGFRMTVQSSNWARNRNATRTVCDANGVARTRNYWVELDRDFNILTVRAIFEDALAEPDIPMPETGLVDTRLVAHGSSWWVVGAIGDAEAGQRREPLVGRLDRIWLRDTARLGGVATDEVWSPIAEDAEGALRCVAGVSPTIVAAYDTQQRTTHVETRHVAPLIARRLHAVTQTIPCAGGYLCLCAERVPDADGRVQAVHRWVWFDVEWHVAKLSRPFRLAEHGFPVASGLTRHGDDLVMSFGVVDGDVWVGDVLERDVLKVLSPPLALDVSAVERQLERDPNLAAVPAPRRNGPGRAASTGPTIASLTMTGNNRDIVGDALRSVVDWVDWCVLIDTGITDDTIDVARAIAGDKLVVREFAWREDFSAARNFALAAAADTGADWGVFVDSDERLDRNGVDIHTVLSETTEQSLLVPYATGEYTKDRFFRLPAVGEFRGPTHEAYYLSWDTGGATVSVPAMVFTELPKSPERFRRKDERDRDILWRHTREHPDVPRSFFYLGDVLQRLGQYEEAVSAFRSCTALRGWDEEGAWAMYRAAFCLIELDRFEEALEAAALGMTRHAGLADLTWLAGYLSLQLGRPQQAVYWARQSIPLGCFAGMGSSVLRVGWRSPFALWEGPYDVLRFALRQLGDEDGASEAERLFEQAKAARLRTEGGET